MKPIFPPRSILVAVDGSPASWCAFSAAQALATVLNARLEAVYVEPIAPVSEFEAASAAAAAIQKELLATLRKKLGAVPLRRLVGLPAAELLRAARPGLAQLLVMGTHGRSGAERLLLGSVTESVIHRARVPVLALRDGGRFYPPRVLAPCNLEPYADEALAYSAAFAAGLEAELTALYVAPRSASEEDAKARLKSHLEKALGPAAARVHRLVRLGEPREQIALEASEGRYGTLALSAHHRKQLSDLALGTTAERLLRRCAVPILTVPDTARARPVKRVEALVWK